MRYKKILLIGCLLYAGLTVFLFVQNRSYLINMVDGSGDAGGEVSVHPQVTRTNGVPQAAGPKPSIYEITSKIFANEKNILREIIEKEEIVDKDKRAMLRAFYTAPPVIPHEVELQDSRDCLRCHLNVTKLDDGRVAMQTPHPQFSSCLQCHVPSQPGGNQEVANTWEGLEEPKHGNRWFLMSPPTMPHRIALRENCLSCHGPHNPDMRLRTPHPQRTSCLQCHVPDYRNEFEMEK